MDKETVVVKVEPEEIVVVKEETVDLTEESVYDTLISFDSKPLTDFAGKCPNNNNGLNLSDAHVKSSFIISKGFKSEVDGERLPSSKYDVGNNGEKGVMNPLTQYPHPVVPPFPLPYMAHTMPWGIYPPSPYLPYPYYQIPMTPFPMQYHHHILGHTQHTNKQLSSILLPHLDVSEKLPSSTLFGHLDTSQPLIYAPVQRPDLKSHINLDKRPLPPGKVKKKHQAASTPYNRTESIIGYVDSPLINAKPTDNNASSNIIEQPPVPANQASDSDFIDVDGLDDISAINKLNFDPTRPFKCTECGRCFAKKYYLSVHMRLHTGEKSYRCSQCPKTFRQRNSLVFHQKNHNDDRPFECSLCERRFTKKSNLKRHFVSHIPEKTGEIKYNELNHI